MKLINSRSNIAIEFTPEEQDFLFTVMQSVAGHPDFSPRKHERVLTKILQNCGAVGIDNVSGGTVQFGDYDSGNMGN
jgi:hypothetical protein